VSLGAGGGGVKVAAAQRASQDEGNLAHHLSKAHKVEDNNLRLAAICKSEPDINLISTCPWHSPCHNLKCPSA
jgi:hypothetical protein